MSNFLTPEIDKAFNLKKTSMHTEQAIFHIKNTIIPYIIYIFKPNQSLEKSNLIKKYLKIEYEKKGYLGFDAKYDQQYDPYSIYFLAMNNSKNKILATARCTFKTNKNSIPFEDSIKVNTTNEQYILNTMNLKIVDINSFIYKEPRILNFFIKSIVQKIFNAGIEKAYCLLDGNSNRYKRIYLQSGFRFSKQFPQQIYFPTFVNKNNKPITWIIMESDRQLAQKIWNI